MHEKVVRGLLIPAHDSDALRIVTIPDDTRAMAKQVFGLDSERDTLAFSSFRFWSAQLAYDDEGLLRPLPGLNRRAMRLWALMIGASPDEFDSPLAGSFLLLGLDPNSGETQDAPVNLVATMLDWEYAERHTEPSQQLCLAFPGLPLGGMHHLVPDGTVLACQYCAQTEKELRR